MLCCFGRPAYGQNSPPAGLPKAHGITDVTNVLTVCSEPRQSDSFVDQTPQPENCPDIEENILQEPWRARLSERLTSWASSNGVRAAGCWACARDRGKCVLVGAAPNSAGNVLRSALHGFFLGSTIDLAIDKTTSVACAISTKALVSVVVLADGQVIGDIPVDLRQLYERLYRTSISVRSGQSNATLVGAWHLAALPLLLHNEAVGALVMAGQLEVPLATPESMESCVKAAVEATMPARLSAAASLTAEFFGTAASLACAQDVVSLVVGVSTAPDHAGAVRNAAVQIHTLLPKAISVKTAATASCIPSAVLTPTKQELLVTTGLVVSRGVATRSGTASTGILCHSGTSQASAATQHSTMSSGPGVSVGPQLHLYHGFNSKAATILPVGETLITRAPIRADVLAAMLSAALAAPVSSAALAAAGSVVPGVASMRGGSAAGPHPQKLLTLRCPEEELPASQPRGDLMALEAAGARAPRGSVVLVSCPLPSIMCAVVVYVCVAPLCAEARPAANQRPNQTDGMTSGGPGELLPRPVDWAISSAGTAGGKGATAHGLQMPAPPDHVVQLTEAQLMLILKHAGSAVEIMASALEHRILSSCAASPARLGMKGPYAVDVTADTSGLVSVSMAGTDGEDSNGFWGSASGPILSGESIPTSHLSAAIPSAGNSVSTPSHSVGRSSKPLRVPTEYARAVAPGAGTTYVASSPGSPLAVSSFPMAQISAKEACMTKVSVTETVDHSSCFQTVTETIEGSPKGGTISRDGTAAAAASRGVEQLRQACSDAITTASPAFEQPFVSGPGPTAAGSSLAKLSSVGNRPPAKFPSNDTDVSQDNALEGGTAVTSPAVATASIDVGVRGASGSAAASSCSASGCSGLESTIKALTYSRMDCDSEHEQIVFQRHAADISPLNPGQEAPKVVQVIAGMHIPSLRNRALQAGARQLQSSCDDNVSRSSGGDVGQPPASTSNSITLESLAVAAVSNTPVVTAAPEGGPYGRPLTEGKSQPLMSVENGLSIVQSFGSNSNAAGGCSVTSVSGDQLARVIVRNRSKDWSDQAGDPESADRRFAATGNGGPGAPRLRPIKVLSLDKAAQQLQRTSGSLMSVGIQQMMPPPPLHVQLQQGFGLHQAGVVAHDSKDGLPAGGMATAPGTSAAPLPVYVPRRLNRMYLQPAVQGASGAIGIPSIPGSAVARATPIARPYGFPLVLSTEPAAPSPPPPYLLEPIQLAARPLGRDYHAVGPGAATAPEQPTVGQPGHPVAARDGMVRLLAEMHAAASRGSFSPASRPLSDLQVPPSGPRGPPGPTQFCTVPPPAVVTKTATINANGHAGGVGTGTESPSASIGSQMSRQLSDFTIPEDAPLEYTVSETVQMMRMLAQARGVHLSARMRRVRITAKIQSAHPEELPANLPSQIAKAALSQSVDGVGLFAGVGRGPAAANGGSWVLTGVAARRGCIELVFDVVQVRGSSGWGAGSGIGAYELPEDVCNLAMRNVAAAVGNSNGQQISPPQLRGSSQGLGVSHGPDHVSLGSGTGAAIWQPQKPGQSGANGQSYRRWQGAGAEKLVDTLGISGDLEDAAVLQTEYAVGAALKAPAGAAAAGEQLWLRNMCGVRPEAVADVLHSCGLLNPSSDPFVDIQIGHTAAGSGTLVWHEASGKWVTANTTTQVAATTIPTASPSSVETPTLWLPTAVAVLARGARILQDIRVVSTAGCIHSRMDVVDELTVRSAFGFLPIRTAVGLRMHAGGAAGSGSSVPPLPLFLEDDPVAESLVDSTCVWRLVDIGGSLPRNGGLLLVECRRSARGLQLEPPSMSATQTPASPAVVSSAPVPLLVLPEQEAAVAVELQRLRVYMARILLGSEDALRTGVGPPHTGGVTVAALPVQTRADAAAQVEMACQQFLMDIGILLDAGASTMAPVNSSRTQVQALKPPSGPSSWPQPGATSGGGPVSLVNMGSTSCGGGSATDRAATYSFSEAHSTSHSRRPQLPELQVSPVCTTDALSSMPSCSSPLMILGACGVGRGTEVMGGWASEIGGGGFGGSCTARDATWSFVEDMRGLMQPRRASSPGLDGSGVSAGSVTPPVVRVTDYGEHLMDVACTVLAGCCTARMLHTAALVLELACRGLSLATPELLLAEAGAEPPVSIELLSVYATRTRQACKDYGYRSTAIKTSIPGTCTMPGTSDVAAAASGPGTGPSQGACARGGMASFDGVGVPEHVSRGDVDWSTTADGQTAAHSMHSRSHSLAVMLLGARSSPTSPLTLQERDGEATPIADFGSWQQDENHAHGSAAQHEELEAEGTEATAAVPTLEAGTCVLDPLPRGGNFPCPGCEAIDFNFQGSVASDFMPTWGSISAAGTPDSAARMASRDRAASNLLGSADMTVVTAATAIEESAQAKVSAMQSKPEPTEQSAREVAAVSELTGSTLNTTSCRSDFQVPALQLASARDSSSCCGGSGGSRLSLARFSAAGCSAEPVPTEVGSEEERGSGFHWLQRQSNGVAPAVRRRGASSDNPITTVLPRDRSDHLAGWAMCFSDSAVEAKYMQFVATRTCSIVWSYFICNAVISFISCTRAWMEDGMESCLTMLVFSGLQGVIMGWYCVAHRARNGRAMVMAAVACKVVRLFSDALMGWRVLKVPSLMEPMTMRGIEIWSEALMRPMAERVPFASYCLMNLFELPCVYLAYRRFQAIFPECWLRKYPLLRTFAFILLAGVVNALVELYWRREFRRWYTSGAGSGSVAAGVHMATDAVIEDSTSPATKPCRKNE